MKQIRLLVVYVFIGQWSVGIEHVPADGLIHDDDASGNKVILLQFLHIVATIRFAGISFAQYRIDGIG